MAYVSFTDGTGAATLEPYTGATSTVGKRFRSWEPFQRPIGEGAWALGSGRHYRWTFRTDYGAAFEIPGIPGDDLSVALRLQAHLIGGGSCTVYTLDNNGAFYSNCYLAPDTDVTIELDDRKAYEFVLRLSVVNLDGDPMVCEY